MLANLFSRERTIVTGGGVSAVLLGETQGEW
jgi:hypothetical protein